MITSIILSYAWYGIFPILIIGAIASYVYIPIIGKYLSIILFSSAAALASYELGYSDRAKLDLSASLELRISGLQSELDEAHKDAEASKKIADDAAVRELNIQAAADDANAKVTNYEAELQKENDTPISEVHKTASCTSVCGLTSRDIARLRSIASGSPGIPPGFAKRP